MGEFSDGRRQFIDDDVNLKCAHNYKRTQIIGK